MSTWPLASTSLQMLSLVVTFIAVGLVALSRASTTISTGPTPNWKSGSTWVTTSRPETVSP